MVHNRLDYTRSFALAKTRQRIPKLRFTTWRKLGWHVAFRDPKTGTPRKHLFNIRDREREAEARVLYHAWVAEHLGANGQSKLPTKAPVPVRAPKRDTRILSGSIAEIASGFLDAEEARARVGSEPRRRGTIAAPVLRDRQKCVHEFLGFLNTQHGPSAVARMRIADLQMEDVEQYNRDIAKRGLSASQVSKRLQLIKAIIDRAGRPEHGKQILTWNWDSRDVAHGAPPQQRRLPTVENLRSLLAATDLRGRTMIWLGIGLGLGARDLSVIRVGQIDEEAYDLRRAKTGVERYGSTPPIVWAYVSKYQTRMCRPHGQVLFVTRTGKPLVHTKGKALGIWWNTLRERAGESKETVPGFYTLRHLGATEFGSRPGTSIGDVKRWLGHTSSSDMADVYMRPVSPEYKKVVQWVRRRLTSTRFKSKRARTQ